MTTTVNYSKICGKRIKITIALHTIEARRKNESIFFLLASFFFTTWNQTKNFS
ncbi:hypothetical protein RC62_2744 [Flavobacterium aquidurense]|uniref:Uncharacterized protein n=1 Tax=Flavobacterium aquidurense TaxID=362413 RepID=A0A0Q0RYR3_9FLAO|nr:hypothetical protein RC62_2744 [Flavobacterium aquidurense]